MHADCSTLRIPSFISAALIYHQEIVTFSLALYLMLLQASCLTSSLVLSEYTMLYDPILHNISVLIVKHSFSNQQQLLNNHYENSFTYPTFILDVYVSSSLDKAFHCVVIGIAGCKMQGSSLIEDRNKKCFSNSNSRFTYLVVA